MKLPLSSASRDQAERVIAAARVALAASGLFAIWLDPAEPVRYTAATYSLHAVYLLYALGLTAIIWRRSTGTRLPIVTHVVDIVLSSIFQYLTLGPSSPFFVYFVFSLFCGAMRWGWRGTLATAGTVIVAFLAMGASMSHTLGPLEFELNRFVIRTVYLGVTAALLVYLGRYEERMRGEIERLAKWPDAAGADVERTARQVAEFSAGIVGAGRAMIVWEGDEEPSLYIASWSSQGATVSRCSPEDLKPLVASGLENATFVSIGDVGPASVLLVHTSDGADATALGSDLHPELLRRIQGTGLASAAFKTERVRGRAVFTDLGAPTTEIVPLTEVVAREIGASLDQLYITRHLQEIAAGEERIRVAQDLHDGVLQSLTGIRLEIRSVAGLDGMDNAMRDRLFAMERAIAIEQRELRLFIAELQPHAAKRDVTPLAARLGALEERIALEWKAPVTIRLAPGSTAIPDRIEQAVPLMVHEAVVNALKHGQPSRVAVTVDTSAERVRIVVSDDGHGFPFRGCYDHAALLERNAGPKSLLRRVTELGGRMSIESTDAGARVEMLLSL